MGKPFFTRIHFIFLFIYLVYMLPSMSKANSQQQIQGPWLLDFYSQDIGHVRTFMYLSAGDSTFSGHSTPKVAGKITGGLTAMLARIATPYFKKGALLHITKGTYRQEADGRIRLRAIFSSALGKFRMEGWISNGILDAKLTRKGNTRAVVRGSRDLPETPLDDYPALLEAALAKTEAHIFNRKYISGKKYRKFKRKLNKIAENAQDDLELVFGFFYRARKLPFSHYFLYKAIENADTIFPNESEPEQQFEMEEKTAATTYLRIRSFDTTPEKMDSLFLLIKENNPKNLIIDLRNNPGGNIAGMKVASNLATKAYYGGVFLTNKWFEKHDAPPKPDEFPNFPLLEEANLSLLWDGIHNEQGLGLKVQPESSIYPGKVYVLTNRNTASTCEPLVYGLKQYKMATIVGETTAGSMLNGEQFKLAGNWTMVIPTADYYTSDGYRIDQKGVNPDIKVKSKEALKHVLNILEQQP